MINVIIINIDPHACMHVPPCHTTSWPKKKHCGRGKVMHVMHVQPPCMISVTSERWQCHFSRQSLSTRTELSSQSDLTSENLQLPFEILLTSSFDLAILTINYACGKEQAGSLKDVDWCLLFLDNFFEKSFIQKSAGARVSLDRL